MFFDGSDLRKERHHLPCPVVGAQVDRKFFEDTLSLLFVVLNRGVLPNPGENPNQLRYLGVVKNALDAARIDIRER